MGGAERVITGVLERRKGLIHGLTCGAGMPYRLSEIAAKFGVYYYPIVSSAARLQRAVEARLLQGGVACWAAWSMRTRGSPAAITGCPTARTRPSPRTRSRACSRCASRCASSGWTRRRSSWPAGSGGSRSGQDWIDNPELGPIAFQFGTRPLLTQESPIGDAWKRRLLTLKEGDVFLNRFSPTGFYSLAVNNGFIHELRERSERQVAYSHRADRRARAEFGIGPRKRPVYLTPPTGPCEAWEARGVHRGDAHARTAR